MTTAYAPQKKISSFHPPQRTLLGPGPSEINPRVLAASSLPAIGYLDPIFVDMMDELKQLLRYAYQTNNQLTFPLSGPGSVGMESCFVNMVEPGEKVVVMKNGVFGGRMVENVERVGGKAVVIEDQWGEPCDPQKLEDTLKKNPDTKVVSFIHAVICDAVTSLAGTPVKVDEWDIDAIYSGSQKCLSCVPGLSPVSYNDAVIEKVKLRKDKNRVQSWFMDLNLVLGYWGETTRTYHHTAPINSLFALHESLLMLKDEGLENAWARHHRHHVALKAGLEAMGLSFLVKEAYRLPQMNAVLIPESVQAKEAQVRKTLLNEFNIEIGAGLGPLAGKIWRIGLMGYSCRADNVMLCLSALGSVLMDMGHAIKVGEAEAAAHQAYATLHAADAQHARKKVA